MVAVLLACLISAPTDCRTIEIYLVERMPTAVAIEAQTRAATWLEQHPGMMMKALRIERGRAA